MKDKTKKITEKKSTIIKRIAIVGGAIAIGVAGYKIGDAVCMRQIGIGLTSMTKADPTLEDHLWKAYELTKNNLKD